MDWNQMQCCTPSSATFRCGNQIPITRDSIGLAVPRLLPLVGIIRPFEETAFDCLSDFYSGRTPRPNYLTAAREKEVLEAWKNRKPS